MSADSGALKIRTMKMTLFFSVILMGIKFFAYWLTNSNAILTDALESIINVLAGSFALFSIIFATRPKDENHPYGHGKIEYLSAGFEGGLIFVAGAAIIAKSIYAFWHPPEIKSLDIGAWLAGLAGLCNYIMGKYLVLKGKRYNSILMIADGKHLISDTVSSIGLIVGLTVILLTKIYWLDNVIAMIFGAFIFLTGYKLVKVSITSLLDEADYGKLNNLIEILNKNRRTKWIDMHNLRVLKYGSQLHIDCHITLPWYDTLEETHNEVRAVEKLVKDNMEDEIEFFIHSDPCLPSQCPICPVQDCRERKTAFVRKLEWTMANMLPDRKHELMLES
jgi:cation diffusion facilitator family transporter